MGEGWGGGWTLNLVGPLPRSPSSPGVALPRRCSPPVIRCSPSTSSGPMGCLPCSGPSLGPGPGSGSDSDPDSVSAPGSRVGSTLRLEAPGTGSAPGPGPLAPFFTFMASQGHRSSPAATATAACAGWSQGEGGESAAPPPAGPQVPSRLRHAHSGVDHTRPAHCLAFPVVEPGSWGVPLRFMVLFDNVDTEHLSPFSLGSSLKVSS